MYEILLSYFYILVVLSMYLAINLIREVFQNYRCLREGVLALQYVLIPRLNSWKCQSQQAVWNKRVDGDAKVARAPIEISLGDPRHSGPKLSLNFTTNDLLVY